MQLSARLRGVSSPVTRRLLIAEQASLAELHVALQVTFGCSDERTFATGKSVTAHNGDAPELYSLLAAAPILNWSKPR
jgi:hypothetical protein